MFFSNTSLILHNAVTTHSVLQSLSAFHVMSLKISASPLIRCAYYNDSHDRCIQWAAKATETSRLSGSGDGGPQDHDSGRKFGMTD